MIKILHLDTGLIFRGGQRQVAMLINNLQRFKVRQYLACPDKSPLIDKTYYTIEHRFPLSRTNFMRFLEKRELRQFTRANEIDLIHAHDSHSHTLATFLTKNDLPRLVVTRRSSGKIGFGSRTKYLAHGIKYIAISDHIRKMLISGGVTDNDVSVISSMIDLDRYHSYSDQAAVSDRPKGRMKIISAGAFDRMKGYHDAVEAVKILASRRTDFEYMLYGDGPEKEKLVRYIRKNGLEDIVRLPGWQAEPADYLRDADIFVSTSYSEGLNMSIVEAMAAGAAVIATAIPPHKENIVHEQSGMLFTPGDTEALAANLIRLLDDDRLRRNIVENARVVAERFDRHEITERIYRLYCDVVAGDK